MIQNPFNPTTIFTRYRYITIALLLTLTHYMMPTMFSRVVWVTVLSEIIYIIIGNLIVSAAQKQYVRTYVTLWMIGMLTFAAEIFFFGDTLNKVFPNPLTWQSVLYTVVMSLLFVRPIEKFINHKYQDLDNPTRGKKQPESSEKP